MGAVPGLFVLADDQGIEVREGGLRPVDRRHPIARLPVAKADEIDAGPVEHAAVIAQRVLFHAFQHTQLDLGDFREIDQFPQLDRHGIATFATISSITCSDVTPWLVA